MNFSSNNSFYNWNNVRHTSYFTLRYMSASKVAGLFRFIIKDR